MSKGLDYQTCGKDFRLTDTDFLEREPMKLATLLTDQGPRVVGVALDGRFVDLCAVDANLSKTMREILAAPEGLAAAAHALAAGMSKGPFVTGKLQAPVGNPDKVFCIGLNYRDHAIETNSPI